jgi:glycosyltransferase involved in cell wall biosynthesis
MKVAILSPVTWRTPPRNYGPWEQVASVLTEALYQKGIDTTLFAIGDSKTAGKLAFVSEKPLGEFPGDAKVAECLHISHLMERADEFDIIHNHFDFLPLTYSGLINIPMITTIHGFSSPAILPVYRKYNASTYYVSISNADRDPSLNYIDTVYNGLDVQQFNLGAGKCDYLLYFGRIHPHKGTNEAIQIAAMAGRKLLICGLIQDQAYFDEKVFPYINDDTVKYLGNVGPEQRNEILGSASALLHPISFDEPFGLSVAEAMLCGTPVIAFNRGAMSELIVEGESGYLVNTVEEAAIALEKINIIGRGNCRRYAAKKFSSQLMADRYISLYKKILKSK